jgi:hypothetical protein
MRTPYDVTTAADLDTSLPVFFTTQEIDFFDYQRLQHDGESYWWDHRLPYDAAAVGGAAWECRQNPSGPFLLLADPANAPLRPSSGGPDGAAHIAGGLADPVGAMLSDVAVVPTGADWTIWAIAYPGSAATSVLFSVAGTGGGGGIRARLRNSNIVDVALRDAGGTTTIVATNNTVPGATWCLIEVAWKQSEGRITIRRNGTQLVTTSGLTLAAHAGRLVLLADYDVTAGAIVTAQGRGVGIAAIGVVHTYSPEDAAWYAKLRAHLGAAPNGYPSITLAE